MLTEPRGISKCSGPHHRVTCSGSVNAANTASRGASKVRITSTWVADSGIGLSFSLEGLEVRAEPVHPALPQLAIGRHPVRGLLQRLDPQRARAVLRVALAGDEAGTLEHLQVPRDGGKADLERRGQ